MYIWTVTYLWRDATFSEFSATWCGLSQILQLNLKKKSYIKHIFAIVIKSIITIYPTRLK